MFKFFLLLIVGLSSVSLYSAGKDQALSLHQAAKQLNFDCIKYHVEDKGTLPSTIDAVGNTALYYALFAQEESSHITNYLLEDHQYTDAETGYVYRVLGHFVNAPLLYQEGPVHWAVRAKKLDDLALIVAKGGRLNVEYDPTMAHVCWDTFKNRMHEWWTLIIDSNATLEELDVPDPTFNSRVFSPLAIAASFDDAENNKAIIAYLLNNNASVDALDCNGKPLLITLQQKSLLPNDFKVEQYNLGDEDDDIQGLDLFLAILVAAHRK